MRRKQPRRRRVRPLRRQAAPPAGANRRRGANDHGAEAYRETRQREGDVILPDGIQPTPARMRAHVAGRATPSLRAFAPLRGL